MIETPLYDASSDYTDPNRIIEVYALVNGSLKMGAGKAMGQCFHAGWVLGNNGYIFIKDGEKHNFLPAWPNPSLADWIAQGRRISVRLVETEHLFERVCNEIEGFAQRDEGMTEVDYGSRTVFITRPFFRDEAPKLVTHKRIQSL